MPKLRELKTGDRVRNKGSGMIYTVLENVILREDAVVVAVMSVTITNPSEWELVERSTSTGIEVNRFSELEAGEAAPQRVKEPEPVQAKPAQQSASTAGGEWKRYEYVHGTSNKFWEIKLAGNKFITRWGRIGSEGSITEKDWPSPFVAQNEYEKIIRSKVAKGYRRVS